MAIPSAVALPRHRSGLSPRSLHRHMPVRAAACGLALIALAVLPACTAIEQARRGNDMAVAVASRYSVEALVQADIERQRIRKARCYSPLLTPANIAAASADVRLGDPWVDDLLRDCPLYASFLSDLLLRRAYSAGIITSFVSPGGPATVGAGPAPAAPPKTP